MLRFTFSVPSLLGVDNDEKRTKGWQDLEKIVREAVWWFGPAEVKQLLKKITKRPKEGRPADKWIHERILAEYDAAVLDVAPKRVEKTKFASGFRRKYHQQLAGRAVCNSPGAVLRMLNRLLKARREAGAKASS